MKVTMHFQPHNLKTAIEACEWARNRHGFEYRIEAGSTITSKEPEYRVNEVLDRFNQLNQ